MRSAGPQKAQLENCTVPVLVSRTINSKSGTTAIPFTPKLTYDLDDKGGFWIAHTAEYLIHMRTFAGDTTVSFSLDAEAPVVSDSERDSLLGRRGTGPSSRFGPEDIPDRKPILRRVISNGADLVLVFPEPGVGGPGQNLDVFSTKGVFLDRVPVPVPVAYPIPAPFARDRWCMARGRAQIPPFPRPDSPHLDAVGHPKTGHRVEDLAGEFDLDSPVAGRSAPHPLTENGLVPEDGVLHQTPPAIP